MIQEFRYVAYDKVPAYLELGWVNLGPISAYSVLMYWPFEGEGVTP